MEQPEDDALFARIGQAKMDVVNHNPSPLPPDEPNVAAMAPLDALANEYGINVAVASSPAPSSYPTCMDVVRVVSGRSMKVGVCADIDVWRGAGDDPTKCVKSLNGRVFELRVK